MTTEARSRRDWPIALAIFAGILGSLVLFIYSRARGIDESTRAWVVEALSRRFKSTVELESLHVRVLPMVTVRGTDLVLHMHDRMDVPPMIQIKEFSFDLGLGALFRQQHHISSVSLRNMVITIPPRQAKPAGEKQPTSKKNLPPKVIVDRIDCDDTVLLILSGKPGKDPLDFDIHDLVLTSVGADQPFDFHGNLTNAKPKGEIVTIGKFGPWVADEPGDSPVLGHYAFTNADLGPFPGIKGILSSTGSYDGQLNSIHTQGQTDTPDFALDPVGRSVPLHTEFNATVDGTDGDTYLHPVTATLGRSVIVCNGSVVRVPSEHGHLITLDVSATKARLEDVLSLAVKAARPPMSGPIKIKSKLTIPPGKERTIEKMILDGDFDADDAHFASSEVREKLASLSRHGLGAPKNEEVGSALSDLKGHFHMENGVITFNNLYFGVEGATILLDGSYKIREGELDFKGQLRLKAALSETMTGVKSVLVKPLDPLFKKDGAGTVIPISITGNRDNPVFAATVFHKTFKKEMSPRERSKPSEK
jgi:AsmA-like C-terminal region